MPKNKDWWQKPGRKIIQAKKDAEVVGIYRYMVEVPKNGSKHTSFSLYTIFIGRTLRIGEKNSTTMSSLQSQ